MNKTTYLNDPSVKAFIGWMGTELKAGAVRKHGYTRPSGPPLAFANLADAFSQYDWDFKFKGVDGRRHEGRTFAENAAVLQWLQENLRKALDRENDNDAVRNAAIDVLAWGGVRAHNEDWMRNDPKRLVAQLRAVMAAFAKDDDNQANLPEGLRFNAGMTKVYSLLIDHFIIYDSRVAGALAWFVGTWAAEKRLAEVPKHLGFRCMPARTWRNAAQVNVRNPSSGPLAFAYLNNNAGNHAQWNLRASWIIEQLLAANPSTPFGAGTEGSRKLEAALFMWGYHLTPVRQAA